MSDGFFLPAPPGLSAVRHKEVLHLQVHRGQQGAEKVQHLQHRAGRYRQVLHLQHRAVRYREALHLQHRQRSDTERNCMCVIDSPFLHLRTEQGTERFGCVYLVMLTWAYSTAKCQAKRVFMRLIAYCLHTQHRVR